MNIFACRVLMIRVISIAFGAAFYLSPESARSNEICPQATLEFMKTSLQCQLQTISWVDVAFEGDLLKDKKVSYERLIRLRLRNDLSMIRHETLEFWAAMSKYEYDLESSEMKKRGSINCLVWTVGDDYPVAEYVECELNGYGDYGFQRDFSSRMLGYSDSSRADEQVQAMIRQIITDISAEFLEARDSANQ